MSFSFRVRGIALLLCIVLVCSLAACGGGGGGSDDDGGGTPGAGDGNTGGGDDGSGEPGEPVDVPGLDANGDIVDSESVYTTPDDSGIINVYVTIQAPDPSGVCRGEEDPAGEEDYSGCTLADLNGGDDPENLGDTDGSDGFDPKLQVQVVIGDQEARAAEMEVRGSSTRLTKQKSYKIEFDKGVDEWFGMERLQLNKHPYDLTRIRNKLSFDLFRQVPDFTSLRTQFVHLYVTDNSQPSRGEQDFGLFTNVEYMNEDWAANHALDKDSNIFKAEQFEFLSPEETPAVTADPDSDEFETVLESKGDDENTATLIAMLEAINDEDDDFDIVFNRYFHPDNFRTWLAINILISNLDTNSQNFYLYRPSAIDNFYFTPWDYDGAWGFTDQPNETDERPRWQHGLANWWGMRLVRRYIENGGVDALTAKMETLNQTVVNAETAQNLINGYPLEEITAIESAEPDVSQLPLDGDNASDPDAQRDAEIARLPSTIASALAEYKQTLNRPMPVYLFAEIVDGNVRLAWDESFDIQSDALVYDVRLSSSPDLDDSSTTCTQEPENPVPMLSGDLLEKDGVTGTSLIADTALVAGQTYYLQVVVRDNAGYCQTAFDEYYDSDADQSYDGVYAFTYDGDAITPVNE